MSIQEITAYVLETAKGYGVSSENPAPTSRLLADLGFDDLDVIEFVMDIEDKFSFGYDSDFEPSECEGMTLQQLIDMAALALGLSEEA